MADGIPLPRDEDLPDDVREVLGNLPPLNVFRAVAGVPQSFRPFLQLGGSLLNLSYGTGRAFIVPHEEAAGQWQGAVCELPMPAFATGIMRGRVNPKDDRVYDLFARVLAQQHKYAVAARVYAEAARLNPDEPQYPFAQGVALIDQGATIDPSRSKASADERAYAFAEAEKALMRAYQISFRKLAEVHLQLARLYEKEGDRARAADELEAYLRKAPGAKNADAIRQAIKTLRERSAPKP